MRKEFLATRRSHRYCQTSKDWDWMVDSDLTPIQFFLGGVIKRIAAQKFLAGKSRVTWRISHALPCRITNALCYVYVTWCNVTMDIECHRQWYDLYLKDIFEAGYKKDSRKARARYPRAAAAEKNVINALFMRRGFCTHNIRWKKRPLLETLERVI